MDDYAPLCFGSGEKISGSDTSLMSEFDDLQAGDTKNPERHPIAIALRRQRGVDDARVSKREVLIKRG